MKLCPFLRVLAILSLCVSWSAYGNDCDASFRKLQPLASIDFIRSRIKELDFFCAIQDTQFQANSFAALKGSDSFDVRYALREMALDVSQKAIYPYEKRVELIRAAAISFSNSKAHTKEDAQADVRMFLQAGTYFQLQKVMPAVLDMMILAIQTNNQFSDADSRLFWGEILLPNQQEAYHYMNQLVSLAELSRGSKRLVNIRNNIIAIDYYDLSFNTINNPPWDKEDSPEEVLERCKELLSLTDILRDDKSCPDCKSNWQWEWNWEWNWEPIMKVGSAYRYLHMMDEAKIYIDQSIKIARSIKDQNSRLGTYRFLLTDLMRMRYEYNVTRSIAGEMMVIANSINTPLAEEIRVNLPKSIQRCLSDEHADMTVCNGF